MAEIPSNITSSAAQAGFQAHEVGRVRDAHSAGQANATNRHARAIDESDTTVDTEDADSQVSTNAEGAGSQGRPFEDSNPEEAENSDKTSTRGITEDDDGHLHVDLDA